MFSVNFEKFKRFIIAESVIEDIVFVVAAAAFFLN